MTSGLSVPTEREVQRAVVDMFRQVGGYVYSLSQGYRPGGRGHGSTRQTLGLADLYVLFPGRGSPLWFEVKRPGGKQTPEQAEFQRRNEACGVASGCGGVPEAVSMLRRLGFTILR